MNSIGNFQLIIRTHFLFELVALSLLLVLGCSVNDTKKQTVDKNKAIRWTDYVNDKVSTKVFACPNHHANKSKKEDTYKMAEANKAFAHYRW